MLIALGNVVWMAALASVITLVLLGLYHLVKKELSLLDCLCLALVGGIGFLTWFALFNGFSLSSLNQDWPIPFFPISPEDIGCAITVLLLTFLYYLLLGRFFNKTKLVQNRWRAYGALAWLLPALVALVIDVYLI